MMDTPDSFSRPGQRTPFQVQRAVVFALFLRELRTRFGQHKQGYLWVILEPVMHVSMLLLVFGMLSSRTMPNVSFPVFLASGVAPWMLFSNVLTRCMVAVSANQGLMGFSPVKPIDTVITRILVELVMFIGMSLALTAVAWWLGHPVEYANPLLLVALIVSLALFGGSLGIMLAIASQRQPDVAKFLPMVIRPLYFVSGIFFMLAPLPTNLQELALLNPLAHWLDLIRVAVFTHYPPATGSLFVIVACTSTTTLLALMLYRIKRFDLVAT